MNQTSKHECNENGKSKCERTETTKELTDISTMLPVPILASSGNFSKLPLITENISNLNSKITCPTTTSLQLSSNSKRQIKNNTEINRTLKSTRDSAKNNKQYIAKSKDKTEKLSVKTITRIPLSKRPAANTKLNGAAMNRTVNAAGDFEITALTARERVAENRKLKVFEEKHKKLQELQSEFINKYESLKLSCPDKLNTEYRFITMIRNDECKLVVNDDDNTKMPRNFPTESISEFKTRVSKIMNGFFTILMENLKEIEVLAKQADRSLELQSLNDRLEKDRNIKMAEFSEFLNVFCISKTDHEIQTVKLQKDLQETKRALTLADRKINDLKTEHTEHVQKIEKDFKEKYISDILKKDFQIKELEKKSKNLERQYEKLKSSFQKIIPENDRREITRLTEEAKCYKEKLTNLDERIAQLEENLASEMKEKEISKDLIKKLKEDLEVATTTSEGTIAQMQQNMNIELEKSKSKIATLQQEVQKLQMDKDEYQIEIDTLRMKHSSFNAVHEDLKQANKRIRDLEEELENYPKLLIDGVEQIQLKDIPMELSKLRQANAEKCREIEKLKIELSKCKFANEHLNEQIERDRQLLEVRSELINSLQQNDNSQRYHMEELFTQVSEKNTNITELNNELRIKTEEFRNLFSTLSRTQMELSHQECMIKLLQESNERSQLLRVKQEEKMSRMEEEIAHLKQTIKHLRQYCQNAFSLP